MAVKFKWYLPVLDRGKKLIGQIKKPAMGFGYSTSFSSIV
jgi:hypothetical protein